jgi:ribonuclease P protein component
VSKQFTLHKKQRLKSHKKIEKLFNSGLRFGVAPFRVVYQLEAATGLQMGVTVPSKIFKKAVDRNRVKRLTREAYRLQCKPLQNLLAQQQKGLSVFFIYTDKHLPDWELVRSKMPVILNKLMQIVNEAVVTNIK